MFVAREGRLLSALAGKMAGAQGGPAVFEVWMKQQSDLVQARAAALQGLAASGFIGKRDEQGGFRFQLSHSNFTRVSMHST